MSDKEKAARNHSISGIATSDNELNQLLLKEKFVSFLAGAEWATPKWIKCSERLPEESGNYLVSRFNGHRGQSLDWNADVRGWNVTSKGERCYELFPTHWMPLPEAPKEEE